MEKIFIELLNMSFQAGIVVCFILLARWVFSLCRVPKKYSYFLWLIPFVRFICPVSLQSVFSLLPKKTEAFYETTSVWLEQGAQNPQTWDNVPVLNQINLSSLAPTPQYSADPLQILTAICSYIWVLVAIALVGYSLCRLFLLKRKLRMSICLRENIYLADEIDTPFVIGLIKPRIYLPSDLEEKELEYVILHEQTHIRRHDAVIKAAAFLITLVHWFNPLSWAAFLCMGNDMEMSCDEAVMRALGQEKGAAYAGALLRLSVGRHRLQGIALAFGEGNTKGRVKNIMKYKKPLMITGVFALLVIAALILGLLTDPLSGGNEPEQETSVVMNDTQSQPETTAAAAGEEETTSATVKKTETAASEKETESPVISYMAEGIPVEEPAEMFTGEGYVILIPLEGWKQEKAESWVSTVNDRVGIQISHYDSKDIPTEKELAEEGFASVGDAALPLHVSRTRDGICEHILHCAGAWRIYYYYPEGAEYEEGFGTLLRVIAATFTPMSSDETISRIEITAPQISPDMLLGVEGTLLDYAGNNRIIFHDYYGLFVFSLNTGGIVGINRTELPYGIVGAVDLAAIGCQDTQGSNSCDVRVSKDGSNVYLHPMEKDYMYVYEVYTQTLTKKSYSLDGIELFDSYAEPEELFKLGACSWRGVRFKGQNGNPDYYGYLTSSDYRLGSLCYVEDDMVFQLFKESAGQTLRMP
ncbi:MAG: hypothetical protein J6B06_04515 [Lachnospiraceae bacterium]|nr:hypothetical protein [Lachnospiraceae bacterium]